MESSLTLRVPASGEGIRRAAEGFDAFSGANALAPDVVSAVQVALDELLSNVVHHGYGGDGGEARLEVLFRLAGGVVEIAIADEAPPFDPLSAPEPDRTAGLAERPVGGLGILLTRSLMDGVEYRRERGRNRVTIRKNIGG